MEASEVEGRETRVAGTSPPPLLLPRTVSRSSAAVSVSLLAAALVGVGQSLLLTGIVGEGEKTDAFLAAYSLYLPVAQLAYTLRGSIIPLFGPTYSDVRLRASAPSVASRAAFVGVSLTVALIATAPITARLVTKGLSDAAQTTAVLTLLVFGPAAVLQYRGAALSAILSAARRFQASSALYVGSGLLGLGISAALLPVLGTAGAAIGVVGAAAALAGGHALYLRRFGIRLRMRPRWLLEREQLSLSVSLISYASLGLAQQINVSIALAAVSDRPGAITVYTFAVFMILLLLNVTSVSLNLVLMPDLVNELSRRGIAAAREYLLQITTVTFIILAPLLAAYLVGGHVILSTVLDPFLSQRSIDLLFDLGRIFCILAVPTAILQAMVSIAAAFRRWRTTLAISGVSVAVQLALVSLAASSGILWVAWAQAAAAAATALVFGAALFKDRMLSLVAGLGRAIVPALLAASPILVLRVPLGPHPQLIPTCAALALALGAYYALVARLWRIVPLPLRPTRT